MQSINHKAIAYYLLLFPVVVLALSLLVWERGLGCHQYHQYCSAECVAIEEIIGFEIDPVAELIAFTSLFFSVFTVPCFIIISIYRILHWAKN
jgi:hypothetical protein